MPRALEEALKRKAAEKGLSKERTGAYVYGNKTMKKFMGNSGQSMPMMKRMGKA